MLNVDSLWRLRDFLLAIVLLCHLTWVEYWRWGSRSQRMSLGHLNRSRKVRPKEALVQSTPSLLRFLRRPQLIINHLYSIFLCKIPVSIWFGLASLLQLIWEVCSCLFLTWRAVLRTVVGSLWSRDRCSWSHDDYVLWRFTVRGESNQWWMVKEMKILFFFSTFLFAFRSVFRHQTLVFHSVRYKAFLTKEQG